MGSDFFFFFYLDGPFPMKMELQELSILLNSCYDFHLVEPV